MNGQSTLLSVAEAQNREPHLGLVEDAQAHSYLTEPLLVNDMFSPDQDIQSGQMMDLDNIPELRLARERGAVQAKHILAANRTKLMEGDFDDAPMPVDPGGTARHAVAVGRKFGKDSAEYMQAFDGLVLDNERLIQEAERANTYEYFARAQEEQNPQTGHFESNGIDIQEITKRGLSPMADAEETLRRINDYQKEVANNVIPKVHALGHLGLGETVTTRSISECLDSAIDAYATDKKSAHGGYVPAIEKFMINQMTFNLAGERLQEQIGLSGLYITHDVIMSVVAQRGGVETTQKLDKTELHSKQFQVGDELLDFVGQLDAEASRVSGKNVFMGEVVEADHPKDYSTVVQDAEVRRAKLAPKPTELANYLINLEENNTDRFAVEGLVDQYINNMLLEVARKDPSKAEAMFDKSTAEGFAKAESLMARGDHTSAIALIEKIKADAPKASFCGAGSCGLESVAEGSVEEKIGRELGLRGKGWLSDKVRRCPSCDKTEILYDNSGNKACMGCKTSQIDGKIHKDEPKKQAPVEEPKSEAIALDRSSEVKKPQQSVQKTAQAI